MSDLFTQILDTIGHSIALSNRTFLSEYSDYIIKDWRAHYVCYDLLQTDYKKAREYTSSCAVTADMNCIEVAQFEILFLQEIRKFTSFISSELANISQSLDAIVAEYSSLSDAGKRKLRDEEQKTTYRIIRELYIKQERLGKFFKLNVFVCNKIGKKFDKLLLKLCNGPLAWQNFDSYRLLQEDIQICIADASKIRDKIIETYSMIFREDYNQLAEGELEYFKSKDGNLKTLPFWIGLKLGLVLALVAWITVDSLLLTGRFYFWTTPGLYVFTSIGGIVVFKITWAICVWVWSQYNVNYIVILQTTNTRPNTAVIMSHSMDICIAYFICLIFFYRANSLVDFATDPVVSYIAPLVLILGFAAYCLTSLCESNTVHLMHTSVVKQSTGIFKLEILFRCISAPFFPIRFPDTFAADALTSFTRIISDTLYATCWLVSGSFLESPTDLKMKISSFGTEAMSCTNNTMSLTVSLFVLLPLWIRWAQCCRQFYDGSDWRKRSFPWFPIGMNGLKYLLSALVVLYSVFLKRVDSFFLFLISFTTLYKWLWDIVVDWGLFDSLRYHSQLKIKGQHIFLRPHLMYSDYRIYYIAIILDLVLRAIWVVSLAPAFLTQGFAKSALQMLMGSLEIVRRGIWCIFRIENEHVAKLYGQALGVVVERNKVDSTAASQILGLVRSNSSANFLANPFQGCGPAGISSQSTKATTSTINQAPLAPGQIQGTENSPTNEGNQSSHGVSAKEAHIRLPSILDYDAESIPPTPSSPRDDETTDQVSELRRTLATPVFTNGLSSNANYFYNSVPINIGPSTDDDYGFEFSNAIPGRNRSSGSVESERSTLFRSRTYSLATVPALSPLDPGIIAGTRSRQSATGEQVLIRSRCQSIDENHSPSRFGYLPARTSMEWPASKNALDALGESNLIDLIGKDRTGDLTIDCPQHDRAIADSLFPPPYDVEAGRLNKTL